GGPHVFAYKLSWGEDVPPAWSGAQILKTRIGAAKKPQTLLFVIDLTGSSVKDARDLPVADVSGSAGKIRNVVVQRNTEISGVRGLFELVPGEADRGESH